MQSVFVFYRTQIIFDIFMNCNAEIAISYSEKKFSKNSSLVTRNAVSCWVIEAYSANSPNITRHRTYHPNRCMLLRMCLLYAQFTLRSLVTLKWVTSELSL